MAEGPARVLATSESVEMGVKDSVLVPANVRGFISVGYDGTRLRWLRVNASGQQVIVGAGIAGTPAGGVVSIQGVVGGTPLPVVSTGGKVDQGDQGTHPKRWMMGISDGVSSFVVVTDGTVSGGERALVVRTIPSGIQPVSDGGGSLTVDDGGGSLSIDSPQLPSSLVSGRLDTNIGSWLGSTGPTVGQKTAAFSLPVVFASDQSPLDVAQSGDWTVLQGSPPWDVAQSGTWTVEQGTPPWSVKGPDSDGASVTENPIAIAGVDDAGKVQTVLTDPDGTVRVRDSNIVPVSGLFSVHLERVALAATTYFLFIDLDGADYKHTTGAAVKLYQIFSKGVKSKSGDKWLVSLATILRINGTDADLGILPHGSLSLRTNGRQESDGVLVPVFPNLLDLTVSTGDYAKVSGFKTLAVTAVNTGTSLVDSFGASATPAVGDVLLKAEKISGTGTLDFEFGAQYLVE